MPKFNSKRFVKIEIGEFECAIIIAWNMKNKIFKPSKKPDITTKTALKEVVAQYIATFGWSRLDVHQEESKRFWFKACEIVKKYY